MVKLSTFTNFVQVHTKRLHFYIHHTIRTYFKALDACSSKQKRVSTSLGKSSIGLILLLCSLGPHQLPGPNNRLRR